MQHQSRSTLATLLGLASIGPMTSHAAVIDPAGFASGQYVSYATPGVSLSTLGLVPVSPPGHYPTAFGPTFSPVFAYGNYFSSTATSASYWSTYDSVTYDVTSTNCLQGCSGSSSMSNIKLLDINFNSPVSEVSVLQYANAFNYAFIQAFNGAGQLIGYCAGDNAGSPQTLRGNAGCFNVVDGTSINNNIWKFTISDSSADISTVLVGAGDQSDHIGTIEYHSVPEPGMVSLLCIGFAGMAFAAPKRRRKAQALGSAC